MLTEADIYALLDARGVDYHVLHHEPVLTVEAAREAGISAAGETYGAVPCKNLFLRDDKSRNFWLVTAPDDAHIDLRTLQARLASRRLSFASEKSLGQMLGIGPGSVTPLAVLNDESRTVTMVFDESLRHQVICAHPLVNTTTVFVASDDVAALVERHGNPCAFLDVQAEGSER